MRKPVALWLLILVVGFAAPLYSQDAAPDDGIGSLNPSHRSIPQGTVGDPTELLKKKMGQASNYVQFRELYQKFLQDPNKYEDRKDLKELANLLKDSSLRLKPNDPLVQHLKEALHQNKPGGSWAGKLTKEERENFDNVVKRYASEQAATPAPGKAGAVNGDISAPAPPGPATPTPGPNPPTPSPSTTADEPEPSEWARWLLKKSEGLVKEDGVLANSPAMRQAMRDWNRYLQKDHGFRLGEEQSTWAGKLFEGLRSRLPEDVVPNDFLKKFGGAHLPSVPPLDMPRVHISNPLPSLRASGTGLQALSPSEAGTGLLWVAAVTMSGLILWQLLQQRRRAAAVAAVQAWKLGPWPVSPGAVATRADLVRAFEYLSFLCLGYTARSRNHLDIAARLGAGEKERLHAAYHLARLYEQARYAPGAEPLPPDALQQARRELYFLAGVAAV